MNWWDLIDEHVKRREEDAPDPWADADVAGGDGLTDDQEAFLAGLADQPSPPRVRAPGDGGSPADG